MIFQLEYKLHETKLFKKDQLIDLPYNLFSFPTTNNLFSSSSRYLHVLSDQCWVQILQLVFQ